MISFPSIDPELIRIGPVALRWYGVMYALGFAASYLLVRYQVNHPVQGSSSDGARRSIPEDFFDSLYVYLVAGLIIGARLGYVLFYDLRAYLADPLELFAVWHGGMSFHGGLIGCIASGAWCCRRHGVDVFRVADLVAITAPIGLGLGRIGNFINGELFGRVTNVPWAMVFPKGGPFPRHPSQIYEFLLEGVALFGILWLLRRRAWPPGVLASVFLVLYGAARFCVEFFREPDAQLGFVLAHALTMGQVLSSVMIVAGVAAAIFFWQRKQG